MPRITDKDGKLWSLMSYKSGIGRVYIRAYRNDWDRQKKRSFPEARMQVAGGAHAGRSLAARRHGQALSRVSGALSRLR